MNKFSISDNTFLKDLEELSDYSNDNDKDMDVVEDDIFSES